ncbi:MAG: hypothetical protein R3B06_14145 [Kofleriaceae bacterium]
MKYRLALILSLATVAAVAACGSDSTGIVEADIACPTPSTLTYANFGQAVITDNCFPCHNGRESPKLDTQAKVMASANAIVNAAVFSSSMPQDHDMTIEQRTQLGQWLRCGAP